MTRDAFPSLTVQAVLNASEEKKRHLRKMPLFSSVLYLVHLSCLVTNARFFTEVLTERLMNELRVLFLPFSNYSRT